MRTNQLSILLLILVGVGLSTCACFLALGQATAPTTKVPERMVVLPPAVRLPVWRIHKVQVTGTPSQSLTLPEVAVPEMSTVSLNGLVMLEGYDFNWSTDGRTVTFTAGQGIMLGDLVRIQYATRI